MIYAKKINGKQRAWMLKYERETTFEPMHQEEIDSGDMTFIESAKSNIRWFEDWSNDVYQRITDSIPGD